MNYRVAEQKDLPALEELALASYGRLKKHLTPENWTKMETLLKSDQTFPLLVRDCHSFVCEENERLLGMAWLVPSGNPTKVYSAETSLHTHGRRASRCRRKGNRTDADKTLHGQSKGNRRNDDQSAFSRNHV